MATAIALPTLAGAQDAPQGTTPFRARVTFENDRVFTGLLSVDDQGELVLDCDVLGGEVIVDFPAVSRIERLTQDDRVEVSGAGEQRALGRDSITMKGGQVAFGSLAGIDNETVMFESDLFGLLNIPRPDVGDLYPGRHQGDAGAGAAAQPNDAARGPAGEIWAAWDVIGPTPRMVPDDAAVRLEDRRTALTRVKDLTGHRVSVELEWRGVPEFRIRFGGDEEVETDASPNDKPTRRVSGGTVFQPWGTTPTLYSGTIAEIEDESLSDNSDGPSSDGVLRVRQANAELGLDSSAIFHFLVKDEETLVLESIEGSDGTRQGLILEFPLGGAADRLTVESLGRPLVVLGIEIRDPKKLVDENGLIQLDRPLRGGELAGYDQETGRLQVTDGEVEFMSSLGVAFMPRDLRGQLSPAGKAKDLGVFRGRSGEVLHATQVVFAKGAIAVRSSYLEAPRPIPLGSLQSVVLPKRRAVRGGANFKMSFDGGGQIEAGFHGIQRDESGYRVLRSEPGFKTTVAGPVAGQVWIERTTRSLFHASRRIYPHDVLLADGQTFPANIVSVDKEKIRLATPFSEDPIELQQTDVKALMFDPRRSEFLLSELTVEPRKKNNEVGFFIHGKEEQKKDKTLVTKQKLRRALLVPRAQKGTPGTHLLIAKNGDLMRGTIVGREENLLVVESSAGGIVDISTDLLAICVRVEQLLDESADPRERKIKTQRSGGQWTVNLGPRATLIGDIEEANSKVFVLQHSLIGRIQVSSDEFKRLDYGRGFAPKFRKILDWQTEPMPEPNIGD